MKQLKGVKSIDSSALTIDDIDAENTPSLVAFYKGFDSVNGIIPDSSGNGLDMSVTLNEWDYASSGAAAGGISEGTWVDRGIHSNNESTSYKDGWFSIGPNSVGLVDVTGTPLDTGSNFIVWSAEFMTEQFIDTTGNANFLKSGIYRAANDIDFGTAWDFSSRHTAADYSGFTAPLALDSWWVRAALSGVSEVNAPVPFTDFYAQNESVAFSGGFAPEDTLYNSINGINQTASTIGVASLTAQDGKFGFSSAGGQERLMFRNYQVWSFPSQPYEFTNTIEWLGYNPGNIPSWWVGR